MKRLAVAILLLAVFGTQALALDAEWIQAHSDLMFFQNAENMSDQQTKYNMYEINNMWGTEHPSGQQIVLGKTITWLGKEQVKRWFPRLATPIEVGLFCANLYYQLHDMSHELDNDPGHFCGGSVTFNTLIRKPTTCTIHWQELGVQSEKDIARILDPRSGMYATLCK